MILTNDWIRQYDSDDKPHVIGCGSNSPDIPQLRKKVLAANESQISLRLLITWNPQKLHGSHQFINVTDRFSWSGQTILRTCRMQDYSILDIVDHTLDITRSPRKIRLIADVLSGGPVVSPPEDDEPGRILTFQRAHNWSTQKKAIEYLDDEYKLVRTAVLTRNVTDQ